jgi:hypothetical protein
MPDDTQQRSIPFGTLLLLAVACGFYVAMLGSTSFSTGIGDSSFGQAIASLFFTFGLWVIVFPIVLPLLVMVYALWARFPAFRAAIPAEPMSAGIWALVLVLSGAALLTASII